MAKAVCFHEIGGPEVLKIEEWCAPKLKHGEVLLRVEAFSINRADILFINGAHYTLPELPSRLGSEAAGVIEAIGPGVTGYAVGDRVTTIPFHNTRYGVQGEQALSHQDFLASWPDGLSAEEATSIWMQYLTAYFPLVEVAALGPDDFVLITAASSSAAMGAIDIARDRGATVIATTRSGTKTNEIRVAGAHHVIPTDHENVAARVLEISDGKGARVIYDPVGGLLFEQYLDAMAEDATVFLYGLLDRRKPEVDVVKFVRKNAVIHPYSMFNHVRHADQLARGIAYVTDRIKRGTFKPKVDRVFALDDAVDAYRHMESGEQIGKIVVRTGT